jgi:hypothetical protein
MYFLENMKICPIAYIAHEFWRVEEEERISEKDPAPPA